MPEPRETHAAIDARRNAQRGAPLVTRALARRLRIVRAERDALAARCERVRALGASWVGFDDSHHYGDAVLNALAPSDPATQEASDG